MNSHPSSSESDNGVERPNSTKAIWHLAERYLAIWFSAKWILSIWKSAKRFSAIRPIDTFCKGQLTSTAEIILISVSTKNERCRTERDRRITECNLLLFSFAQQPEQIKTNTLRCWTFCAVTALCAKCVNCLCVSINVSRKEKFQCQVNSPLVLVNLCIRPNGFRLDIITTKWRLTIRRSAKWHFSKWSRLLRAWKALYLSEPLSKPSKWVLKRE